MMTDNDHPVIWLEPSCAACASKYIGGDDRTWCQDDVYPPCEDCGRKATKYELAKGTG